MNYFKSAKFIFRIGPIGFFATDKMTQFGVLDRLPKLFQLGPRALGRQFHPAIGQVTDRPCHIKPSCQHFNCKSKPNALDPARIKNM